MEPTVPVPTAGALGRLEPRLSRRAEPRLTIALAAAGCALVVLGTITVGGDRLADDGGDFASRLPGLGLSLAVVVAGFVLLVQQRTGPLATAGSVASTLAVPPLLFFLTFDENSFPPYSTEVILIVSTLVWLGAWFFGPGRGRPLYLGAAAIGLWFTVLQVVEEVFTTPFALFEPFRGGFTGEDEFGFGFEPELPDPTIVGLLSLIFGAGYLVLGRQWDRHGRVGAATPLMAPALLALAAGVASLGDDLETAGTGILAMIVGTAVAAVGASVRRRATTWVGAAGAAFGALLVVTEITDEPTPGGLLLIAVGIAVVVAAEALRRAIAETDELLADEAAGPIVF